MLSDPLRLLDRRGEGETTKIPAEEHFPRFTLDDNEHVSLIATYVAAGRWQEINILQGQPQPWFLNFARSLKGDRVESINAVFTMLQHVLMAQRESDFLAIQLQPAFSAFAHANAVALTKAAKGGDLVFTAEWNRIFVQGWEEGVPEPTLTTYTGGPGDSLETAVTIQAPDLATAIHGEYWYLFYRNGRDWKLGEERRSIPATNGKLFDHIELIFPGQLREWAYFDVTMLVSSSSKPV
jgi:hypothetical protein